MNAAFVRDALRRRYPAQEYALFFEVADATGARQTRWADAIAMSLWPSRGLVLHGYEIKVDRRDWLREMQTPAKAEAIARRCDFWWVAAPAGIVHLDELPDTWGHQLVHNDGLITVARPAARMEAAPLDRTFLAAMLRSAGKVDDAVVQRLVDRKVAALREYDEKSFEDRLERRRGEDKAAAEHLTRIKAALQAAGVEDDMRWLASDEIAAAVAVVVKAHLFQAYSGLPDLHAALANAASDLLPKLEATLAALGVPTIDQKAGRLRRHLGRIRKKP